MSNKQKQHTHGMDGAKPQSISRLMEAMPPHALEAEESLLGAIVIDPTVLNDVQLILRGPDDFFKKANGTIYTLMAELYDKYETVDLVQLQQVAKDRDVLDAVGGVEYLIKVAHAVPSAASAAHYARLVKEKSTIRQLIGAAGEILQDAYTKPENPDEILEEAERRIFSIAQQRELRHAEKLDDLLNAAIQQLEENDGRLITGVSTGYSDLDEMTSGLQRGEMVIIAARPSMGKTAFALNMAENMAMRDVPVALFSLEMSRQQLVQRLLSSRASVSGHNIRRNSLSDRDMAAIIQAADDLMQRPLFIDDTPSLSITQLRAKARRLKQQHDIGVLIIDYLQLMTSGKRAESRQQEVSEISRGVKALARELDIPVICLSQLNRGAEQREGHRPRMSDLRESGSIEQDADVVAMLHRESYYHINDPAWLEANAEKENLAELIIAKQRNGPTGTVPLVWDNTCTRFHDGSSIRPPGGGGMAAVIPQGDDPFSNDNFDDLAI
ncbi:MAG: replicative DNA helicase [Phycisphaerales bacterium]